MKENEERKKEVKEGGGRQGGDCLDVAQGALMQATFPGAKPSLIWR